MRVGLGLLKAGLVGLLKAVYCLGLLGRVRYPEARSGLLEIQFSPFVAG